MCGGVALRSAALYLNGNCITEIGARRLRASMQGLCDYRLDLTGNPVGEPFVVQSTDRWFL